ncbi:hypothetical protein J4474_01715 [Candidatus Pacearchaeota archaeon]|nr:hypothetical protein [Candidatus Pacearchaeota archaeon]
MLKDLLKEVVNSIVGKQAEGVVDLLYDSSYINEFIIAKKLDVTINQARNFLYKLSDFGLVSSIRKKDKKKGWYTYFWKIETLKSLEFLKGVLQRNINNLNSQLNSRETKQFFVCTRCNVELNEEGALLNNFICPECGDVFQLRDNSKLIKEMKKSIDKAESELKAVNDEIIIESAKVEKKHVSEMKRGEKKKSKERAKNRERSKQERVKNKKSSAGKLKDSSKKKLVKKEKKKTAVVKKKKK